MGSVNTMSLGYASRKVVLDVEKREKIDLVQDRRPRYVDPELLPSVKVLSLVEKMSQVCAPCVQIFHCLASADVHCNGGAGVYRIG